MRYRISGTVLSGLIIAAFGCVLLLVHLGSAARALCGCSMGVAAVAVILIWVPARAVFAWVGFAANLLTALGAVLALLIAGRPTAAATAAGCPALPARPSWAAVVSTVTGRGDDLTFAKVRYSLQQDPSSGDLYFTAAGDTDGQVPRGDALYVVGAPDPTSTDSFGHQLKVRYLPSQEIEPGCWTIQIRRVGYHGICGLRSQYYFTLVSDAVADQFDADKVLHTANPQARNDGYTPASMLAMGVKYLAGFTVDTAKNCRWPLPGQSATPGAPTRPS